MTQIWVDADACPGQIKELLYRTAKRRGIKVTLVANQPIRTPKSEHIESVLVPSGMNVADRRIAARQKCWDRCRSHRADAASSPCGG